MLHFPTKNSQPKFSVTDRSRGFVKPLVLVVEDQEINADLLRQLLHKVGICCAWARNGAEAVRCSWKMRSVETKSNVPAKPTARICL